MFIYALSLFIVVLDQLTKYLALKYLSPHQSIPVIPDVFHLSLVKNTGIAFGLFGDRAQLLTAVVIVCLLGLLFLAFQMRHARLLERVSLGFILGGAAGNLIDRITAGHVVDFFDFRIWPVFNVADSFITVGVVMFLLLTFRKA